MRIIVSFLLVATFLNAPRAYAVDVSALLSVCGPLMMAVGIFLGKSPKEPAPDRLMKTETLVIKSQAVEEYLEIVIHTYKTGAGYTQVVSAHRQANLDFVSTHPNAHPRTGIMINSGGNPASLLEVIEFSRRLNKAGLSEDLMAYEQIIAETTHFFMTNSSSRNWNKSFVDSRPNLAYSQADTSIYVIDRKADASGNIVMGIGGMTGVMRFSVAPYEMFSQRDTKHTGTPTLPTFPLLREGESTIGFGRPGLTLRTGTNGIDFIDAGGVAKLGVEHSYGIMVPRQAKRYPTRIPGLWMGRGIAAEPANLAILRGSNKTALPEMVARMLYALAESPYFKDVDPDATVFYTYVEAPTIKETPQGPKEEISWAEGFYSKVGKFARVPYYDSNGVFQPAGTPFSKPPGHPDQTKWILIGTSLNNLKTIVYLAPTLKGMTYEEALEYRKRLHNIILGDLVNHP